MSTPESVKLNMPRNLLMKFKKILNYLSYLLAFQSDTAHLQLEENETPTY